MIDLERKSPIETAKTLSVGIGTIALYDIGKQGKFFVRVKVTDMRQRYGMVDACIQPIEGVGAAWVEARSLCIEGEDSVKRIERIG